MPFIRTFAPFVAGVAAMSRSKFTLFNVVGAVVSGAGHLHGAGTFLAICPGCRPTWKKSLGLDFGARL